MSICKNVSFQLAIRRLADTYMFSPGRPEGSVVVQSFVLVSAYRSMGCPSCAKNIIIAAKDTIHDCEWKLAKIQVDELK